MSNTILLKRIYETAAADDGYRVLVDRLWPRGISKEKAAIDLWIKDLAPSDELRKWFGHDIAKFEAFTIRYHQELLSNPALVTFLNHIKPYSVVTLLFAASDKTHNNAVVLRDMLLTDSK